MKETTSARNGLMRLEIRPADCILPMGDVKKEKAKQMMLFLTLFAENIYRTAQVYECLDLVFVEEQHGSGPVHLASEQAGQVLEIYPGLDVAGRSALLGYEVAHLDRTRAALVRLGVEVIKNIADVDGIRRMIIRDPDGREIFVQERLSD